MNNSDEPLVFALDSDISLMLKRLIGRLADFAPNTDTEIESNLGSILVTTLLYESLDDVIEIAQEGLVRSLTLGQNKVMTDRWDEVLELLEYFKELIIVFYTRYYHHEVFLEVIEDYLPTVDLTSIGIEDYFGVEFSHNYTQMKIG